MAVVADTLYKDRRVVEGRVIMHPTYHNAYRLQLEITIPENTSGSTNCDLLLNCVGNAIHWVLDKQQSYESVFVKLNECTSNNITLTTLQHKLFSKATHWIPDVSASLNNSVGNPVDKCTRYTLYTDLIYAKIGDEYHATLGDDIESPAATKKLKRDVTRSVYWIRAGVTDTCSSPQLSFPTAAIYDNIAVDEATKARMSFADTITIVE